MSGVSPEDPKTALGVGSKTNENISGEGVKKVDKRKVTFELLEKDFIKLKIFCFKNSVTIQDFVEDCVVSELTLKPKQKEIEG